MLPRKFKFGKKELKDFDRNMSPNQIMAHYAGHYPELNNAKVEGPKIEKDHEVWNFTTSLAPKS